MVHKNNIMVISHFLTVFCVKMCLKYIDNLIEKIILDYPLTKQILPKGQIFQ